MKPTVILNALVVIVVAVNSAIVFPDDVTTIAQIFYSMTPPVKIGQDSRLGLGFRVGPSADAQFLLELGPQNNTVPLGDSAAKRQTRGQRLRPTYTAAERERILRGILDRMRKRVGATVTEQEETEKGKKTVKTN